MPHPKPARRFLLFFVLTFVASPVRAGDFEEARACFEGSLDDIATFRAYVPAECPSRSRAYGDSETTLDFFPVGLGGTLLVSSDTPFSCGGGSASAFWETPTPVTATREDFIPSGHDETRGVVYGLVSFDDHFQSSFGPFEAARFVLAEQRLERLGVKCLSIAVVASADAFVCEHGDSRATTGSLALDAPLPRASDAEPFSVSMHDLQNGAYEIGRGLFVTRARIPPTRRQRYDALVGYVGALPRTTPETRAVASIATSTPGAIVDLGLMVDGPLLVARLALVRALRVHAGLSDTLERNSVLTLGLGGWGPHTLTVDATATLARAARTLSLAAAAPEDVFLGAVWSRPDGAMPPLLEDWANALRAGGLAPVRTIALRLRPSTSRFLFEVVIETRDTRMVRRHRELLDWPATETRIEPSSGTSTRLVREVAVDDVGTVLAGLFAVPMSPAFAQRLRAAEARNARRGRDTRAKGERACSAPRAAMRARDYLALSLRGEDCEPLDAALVEEVVGDATRACIADDEHACAVLARGSGDFEMRYEVDSMLRERCERRGGPSCEVVFGEEDSPSAWRAMERRCAAGVVSDCNQLLHRAIAEEESADTIDAATRAACDAGSAHACRSRAGAELRACVGRAACLDVGERMLHACELGSTEACGTLERSAVWRRVTGVPIRSLVHALGE